MRKYQSLEDIADVFDRACSDAKRERHQSKDRIERDRLMSVAAAWGAAADFLRNAEIVE